MDFQESSHNLWYCWREKHSLPRSKVGNTINTKITYGKYWNLETKNVILMLGWAIQFIQITVSNVRMIELERHTVIIKIQMQTQEKSAAHSFLSNQNFAENCSALFNKNSEISFCLLTILQHKYYILKWNIAMHFRER